MEQHFFTILHFWFKEYGEAGVNVISRRHIVVQSQQEWNLVISETSMIILRVPKPTLFIAKSVNPITNEKHVADKFPSGSVKFVL